MTEEGEIRTNLQYERRKIRTTLLLLAVAVAALTSLIRLHLGHAVPGSYGHGGGGDDDGDDDRQWW